MNTSMDSVLMQTNTSTATFLIVWDVGYLLQRFLLVNGIHEYQCLLICDPAPVRNIELNIFGHDHLYMY